MTIMWKQELMNCPCTCGNKETGIVCYCADPNKIPDGMYSTIEYLGDDPHKASLQASTWSQYHLNGMSQEEYYWWCRYHDTCDRFKEAKRELEWDPDEHGGLPLSWVQWEHVKNEDIRQVFIDDLEGMTFGNNPTEGEYNDRVEW